MFDGGLVTNADPEDIDKTAAIVTTNFETDVPGKLVKRQGRAAAVDISGDTVGQITKWTNQDLAAPIWIYYETQNDTINSCTAAFASPADIKSLHASTTSVQINNFGRRLRFAGGINNKPGIYQTIDRQFFFGSKDLSGGNKVLNFDDAPPYLPGTWENEKIKEFETGTRQSGFYYYAFVPVFDGNQEHPFPEGFSFSEITNNNKTLRVGLKMSKATGANFNPRITAVKVYRSFSATAIGNIDPVYYHITTIPLSTKSDHEDILASESVLPLDNQVYISGDLSEEPGDWGAGNHATRGLLIGAKTETAQLSSGAIEYYIDDQEWPGTSTGGLFTIVTQGGSATSISEANKIFDGAYTMVVQEVQSSPAIFDVVYTEDSNCYAGDNVIYKSDWSWHAGEANGRIVYSSAEDPDVEEVVIDSKEKAIKLGNDLTQTAAFTVAITDGYRYEISGNDVTLWFYDYDLNDKSLHPLGDKTKITVNHQYAVYLMGRLFVGNVRLDPDGDAEDHEDWIIFSELLQPDVLPITNYIQIKDTQGGQITGLGKHLGSLVVFMERGIYRLDVPSTDPSQFALMESEENFGCIAPDSIVTVGGQTFFAGEDNAYVIDAGFDISPITLPIKDVYQAKTNLENSRFFYDPKKQRMLCRFGDDKQNIYSYDIRKSRSGKAVWDQLDMGSDVADLFAIDENLDVYTITNS